jgi:hypothetical protein
MDEDVTYRYDNVANLESGFYYIKPYGIIVGNVII